MQVNNDLLDKQLEQSLLEIGIPPCPEILLNLVQESRKEEPDFQRIEKLISADVGLSATLIKTVNSPFYGLRIRVYSVMQAIHIMGLSRLFLMVTGMVLRDVLSALNKVDMERFWDTSSKLAVISSYLAGRLPYLAYEKMRRTVDKDEAFTYGLFQDCGIPLLLNHYPDYKEVLGLANQSMEMFTALEDRRYRQNHAMVGYYLAKSWGLPESMYLAIRYHHEHEALASQDMRIPEESRDLIGITLLAESSIQLLTGRSWSCEWDKGQAWVFERFGLSDDEFGSIVKGIGVLFEEGNVVL